MKRYRVTVGLCLNDDPARQYFITSKPVTRRGISSAIRRAASKKYVKELVGRVGR